MKKFEEELEIELEKALAEPLQDKQPTDLSQFDKDLENNKKSRVKITYFRRIALASALVLMVTLTCLIPVWTRDKNNNPPEIIRYYGDTNTIQVEVDEDFIQDYINENLSNYNFIFEDCSVSDIWAVYDKETSKELLALKFTANKTSGLPTKISVNIVLNKNYSYSDHLKYINNASIKQTDNKTIYSTEVNDINYNLFVLIDRLKYNTYLNLNINDTEILNKFKEN